VTVGTFQSILRRESDWGVGFATGSRETVPQKIGNLHQTLAGLALNVTGHCVSMMKGIVLLSSISWKGVGWVVVQGEGVGW
jgi:hypothetical protein